jgi:hypothetical protein
VLVDDRPAAKLEPVLVRAVLGVVEHDLGLAQHRPSSLAAIRHPERGAQLPVVCEPKLVREA